MSREAISPVFVVGSARSGTSLVYSVLLATNKFPLYNAETLLLRTCANKYGPLSRKSNYNKFISNWIKSKQFIRSGLDKESFITKAVQHRTTYFDFLDFFMGETAKKQGKNHWAENTPNHVLEICNIAKYFPRAKFIHVIRDGRAVSASLNKLNWISIKQPSLRVMSAGIHWQTQVLSGREQGKMLGHRYMELYYEKLVCQPEKTLRQLSKFTGININMHQLTATPYGTLGKNNSVYQKNGARNNDLFSKNALNRWKNILSSKEQSILNTVIGNTLYDFGYTVGETTNVNQLSIIYCKTIYHLKEWLRHNTILGRNSETDLEFNNDKKK